MDIEPVKPRVPETTVRYRRRLLVEFLSEDLGNQSRQTLPISLSHLLVESRGRSAGPAAGRASVFCPGEERA